jgi:hypothetical protein
MTTAESYIGNTWEQSEMFKLAIIISAIAFATPAFAQSGASSGNAGSAPSSQSVNQNQQGANGSGASMNAQSATTGANTRPEEPSSSTVSAPGVGVGHAANGKMIGSPGSGPGSPEQPIDGKNLGR